MKGFRSTVAAMMAAVLLLAPPLSLAGEYQDGHTPSNGTAPGSTPISGWSGSANKAVRTDASGILRITEEYPYQLQNDRFPSATSVAVHTGIKQIGLGWSVSPFGDRAIRITRVATGGTAVSPVFVYLFGSDDDVTYYPLTSGAAWTGSGQALTDSTKIDTLRAVLPSGATGGVSTMNWKITIPGDVYPGRYLAIYAARPDSANGSAIALTVSYEGRWK